MLIRYARVVKQMQLTCGDKVLVGEAWMVHIVNTAGQQRRQLLQRRKHALHKMSTKDIIGQEPTDKNKIFFNSIRKFILYKCKSCLISPFLKRQCREILTSGNSDFFTKLVKMFNRLSIVVYTERLSEGVKVIWINYLRAVTDLQKFDNLN